MQYPNARLAAHFGRLALGQTEPKMGEVLGLLNCTCDVDAFNFDCPVHR